MSADKIGDMLTTIRNANSRNHNFVLIPYTNLNLRILSLLKEESFIHDYRKLTYEKRNNLLVVLASGSGLTGPGKSNTSRISEIKRISKPGRRIYASAKKMPLKLNGKGTVIVSTPKGIITTNTIKEKSGYNVGGEVLFSIW